MATVVDTETMARVASEAALSRRARNVTMVDLRGLGAFTDFFVICTGTSDTHAAGIAEIVYQRMREEGHRLLHREGSRRSAWTLLDYVDTVIHVFTREAREFYALERLWAEAPTTVLEDDEAPLDTEWDDVDDEPRPLTARDFV
ncbi:ribosome silencing factor [Candidatus Poribacteria bacterium]|nr:ribosome silencing factor [Candidatus Poribacteria bacterium]